MVTFAEVFGLFQLIATSCSLRYFTNSRVEFLQETNNLINLNGGKADDLFRAGRAGTGSPDSES